MGTIERLDRDVQSAMQAARALGDRSTGTLTEVEHDLWLSLLGVGRAVIALYLAKRAARPRVAQYTHDGVEYVLDARNPRKSLVGTRFGKVTFSRTVGTAIGARQRSDRAAFQAERPGKWPANRSPSTRPSVAMTGWANP